MTAAVVPAPKSRLSELVSARETPVIVGLIALVIITSVLNPLFLSPQGLKDLLLNATILMIMATGQSLIIISRSVDLSVGSVLGMVAFTVGWLFGNYPGIPIIAVFAIGILFGAFLGVVNGVLVVGARVPAMVITLGTLYVFRGLLNWWAGPKQYFAGDRPKAFGDLSVNTLAGVPLITILGVLVIIAVSIVLRYTRMGRDLYAIGSDPDAAVVYGIPVARRTLFAFVLNGALVGLAGVLYASRFNSVGAVTGSAMELQVVAAAVVGGVAISGGVGSAIGAAVGAFLLITITSALTALGVDKFWQQAVVGMLILAAIIIDRVASIRKAGQLRKQQA